MRRPSFSNQETVANTTDRKPVIVRKESAIKPEDLPAIIAKVNEKEKPKIGSRRDSRLNVQNKLFKEVSSSTLSVPTTSVSRRGSLLTRQTSATTKSGKSPDLSSKLRREVSQLNRPTTSAIAIAGDELAALHGTGSRQTAVSKPPVLKDLSGRLYVSRGSTKNNAW